MLKSVYSNKNKAEAGCDEAGRGCLAGPVVAAAVILPKDYVSSELNDSKQINETKRNKLRIEIEKEALAYAVGVCSPEEIDQFNILTASFLAMHKAIKQLKKTPDFLLIDGNKFTAYPEIKHACIVKGDGKYLSIAAASVLAKTYRDELMLRYHEQYPAYAWHKNKGYPTVEHKKALAKLGPCKLHRKSFSPNLSQYSIF